MSLEDPFINSKNDLISSLDNTRQLYKFWSELRSSSDDGKNGEFKSEFDDRTLELRNQIRSLEWGLEDIEETFAIYESYPEKMKLSDAELATREQFITETKDEIQLLKNEVFDSKYNVKERNTIASLINPIDYYSIAFDGSNTTNLNGQRYKRLENDGGGGSNRLASDEKERIGLALRGDIGISIDENLLNTSPTTQDDHHDEDMAAINVIGAKYDSPLKRMARAFQLSHDRRQLTAFGLVTSFFLLVIFSFALF